MKTFNKVILSASLLFSGLSFASSNIEMYKSPSCGCCTEWADIMEQKGYQVDIQEQKDWTNVKRDFGMPAKLQSCHTAIIDGYLIEGHVPEKEVARLLKERPQDIKGLAAPGMPMHSPGMAKPGDAYKDFDVIAFHADGTTSVYAEY